MMGPAGISRTHHALWNHDLPFHSRRRSPSWDHGPTWLSQASILLNGTPTCRTSWARCSSVIESRTARRSGDVADSGRAAWLCARVGNGVRLRLLKYRCAVRRPSRAPTNTLATGIATDATTDATADVARDPVADVPTDVATDLAVAAVIDVAISAAAFSGTAASACAASACAAATYDAS